MANRKFIDRNGARWEVREHSRNEWVLEPIEGNPGAPHSVRPPTYETDPFELTDQELRRLLEQSESAARPQGPAKTSPFID